ncbi:TolC family protein [Flavobacterium microcysteis]
MKKHILFYLGMLYLCQTVAAQNIWTLKECIAYGRANSFEASEIKILNASYKEDKKSIRASYLPQYNLVANGAFTANNNSFVWSPNAGLEINTIVSSGFRKKHELKKADLIIAQSEYGIAMAENTVEMQVLYAYTEALTKKSQYQICVDFYEKTKELYEEFSASKLLSQTDEYFFNVLLQQDYQEIESLQQQYAIALLKIRQTINLYDDSDFEIAEIPSFKASHTDLNEAYPLAILADPGISSNQIDIDIARENSAIARTLVLPSISLRYAPYYELNKPGLQHYAGLQISLPIFNRTIQKVAIEKAAIQGLFQEKQLENQKELLWNAVVLIISELKNRQALYEISRLTLEKSSRLLKDSEEKLKNKNTYAEAYLVVRNWNKQCALDTVVLKYQAITQAKLLDFYTGTTL